MTKRALLIVDLEATCWEGAQHKPGNMEIIEIGALLIGPDDIEQVSEFQTFVRPVRCPVLSNFCKALTSIQQGDVDAAESFREAFGRFLGWIGDPQKVRFSSWGEYDRKQFLRDCSFHKVRYPFSEDHFNIKMYVAEVLGCKPQGLGRRSWSAPQAAWPDRFRRTGKAEIRRFLRGSEVDPVPRPYCISWSW